MDSRQLPSANWRRTLREIGILFLAGIAGAFVVAPLRTETAAGAELQATKVNPHAVTGALTRRNVLVTTFDCSRFAPGHGATASEGRTITAFLAAMQPPNAIIGRRYCEWAPGGQSRCQIGATGPHKYRERIVQFEFRVAGDCAQFHLEASPAARVGSRGGTRVITVEESGIVRWSLRIDSGPGAGLQTRSHFYYHLRDPAGPPPLLNPVG